MPLATVLLASIVFVPWPAPPSVTATSASREPVVRLRTPSPRASYEGSDACQPQPPNVYYNQPQVDKVAEFIRQETPGFDDQQWSPGAPNHDGANVAPSYDVNAAAPGYWAATGSYWATSEYDAQWTPSGVDAYEANVAPDFDPNQAIPPPLPVTDDPFVLLGLDPAFAGDVSAIRSSYLRQAKAYHPDASVTSATPEHIKQRINDDFSRIQAAYSTAGRRRFVRHEPHGNTQGAQQLARGKAMARGSWKHRIRLWPVDGGTLEVQRGSTNECPEARATSASAQLCEVLWFCRIHE